MALKITSDSTDPVPTCYAYSALFYCLVGTVASAATFLTVTAGIFAVWRLFISGSLKRIEVRGLNVVWVAVFAFYAAGALSAVFYPADRESLNQLIERLPFLFLPPLIVFFAQAAEPLKLLRWSVFGALAGIIVLTAYTSYAQVFTGARLEGLSGNANVFGYMCGFLVIWLSLGLKLMEQLWVKAACLLALLVGIAFVAYSGSRGGMLAVIVGLAIMAWYLPSWNRSWLRFGAIGSLVIVTIAIASFTVVGQRTTVFLDRITQDGFALSQFDGQRAAIWQCGIDIARDAAIFGQGHDAALSAMKSCVRTLTEKSLTYSHFHNLFIDQFAKGGVVGLLTASFLILVPLLLMLQWFRAGRLSMSNPMHRMLAATGLSFWLMHMITSLVNIGLGHDAIDSMFIYTAALILGTAFAVQSSELK